MFRTDYLLANIIQCVAQTVVSSLLVYNLYVEELEFGCWCAGAEMSHSTSYKVTFKGDSKVYFKMFCDSICSLGVR